MSLDREELGRIAFENDRIAGGEYNDLSWDEVGEVVREAYCTEAKAVAAHVVEHCANVLEDDATAVSHQVKALNGMGARLTRKQGEQDGFTRAAARIRQELK